MFQYVFTTLAIYLSVVVVQFQMKIGVKKVRLEVTAGSLLHDWHLCIKQALRYVVATIKDGELTNLTGLSFFFDANEDNQTCDVTGSRTMID